MSTVGVIGLGRMGLAIAKRLVVHGFAVVGWDVLASRQAACEHEGARFAADPGAVVAASDFVISIVTDDAAVQWLFGDGGLLAGDPAGRLFIEMSTVQPSTIQKIGALAEAAGARLIAAPVLGTVATVDEGKLLALASGRPADIAYAAPVLSVLTRDVVNLGPLGAGNAMKLVVNLTMAAYLQSLAEGLALGDQYGLQIDDMLRVLAEAPTANPWLAVKRPILAGGTGPTSLDIATLLKDVLAAVATGASAGVTMPLAAGVLSSLAAAVAAGYATADLAELPQFFRAHMVRRAYGGPSHTPAETR